jgi:transposase-like protein
VFHSEYVAVADLARELDVSPPTVRRWVRVLEIATVKRQVRPPGRLETTFSNEDADRIREALAFRKNPRTDGALTNTTKRREA